MGADFLIREMSINRLFIVDSTRFFKQVIWCINFMMPNTSLNKLWSHEEQFKAYLSVYSVNYDDERLLLADFKTTFILIQGSFLYSQTINTYTVTS